MVSALEKFSKLLERKCNNITEEYFRLLLQKYPILAEKCSEDLYERKEALFAQKNVDMKIECFTYECYKKYLEKRLAGVDCGFQYNLFVSMESLKLIEIVMKESVLTIQEKYYILNFYLKEYIDFFANQNNKRNYDLGLVTRDNVRFRYATKGPKPMAEYLHDMTLIKDGRNRILGSISELESDFFAKHKVAMECKNIVESNGIDSLYNKPELLKEFGLTEEFINQIAVFAKNENLVSFNESKVKKYNHSENKVEDLSWVFEELKKYMIDDEFVGLIQGTDLNTFISLASKVYTPKKVELLKEKLLLNNDRIISEQDYRRKHVRNKILHEDDKIFYYYICDLDLTDQNLVPYVAQIQYTITTIEGLVDDLVVNYDEELKDLYLEETQALINNLKVCLPSIQIVL